MVVFSPPIPNLLKPGWWTATKINKRNNNGERKTRGQMG
jgi:hypothetical protein